MSRVSSRSPPPPASVPLAHGRRLLASLAALPVITDVHLLLQDARVVAVSLSFKSEVPRESRRPEAAFGRLLHLLCAWVRKSAPGFELPRNGGVVLEIRADGTRVRGESRSRFRTPGLPPTVEPEAGGVGEREPARVS